MRFFSILFFELLSLLLLFSSALAQTEDAPQTNLPHTTLSAGMYQIDAQVAQTDAQRMTGLMYRAAMPQHEGMLFIFDTPTKQCFWMRNTRIALTAAFVADDGAIVNLVDMQPQTTQTHCSMKPVRFVLEMNQHWFAKKGIKAGTRLQGEVFKP